MIAKHLVGACSLSLVAWTVARASGWNARKNRARTEEKTPGDTQAVRERSAARIDGMRREQTEPEYIHSCISEPEGDICSGMRTPGCNRCVASVANIEECRCVAFPSATCCNTRAAPFTTSFAHKMLGAGGSLPWNLAARAPSAAELLEPYVAACQRATAMNSTIIGQVAWLAG